MATLQLTCFRFAGGTTPEERQNALLPGILQRPNRHPVIETFLQAHPKAKFPDVDAHWRQNVFKLPKQSPETLVRLHVMGAFSRRSGIPGPFVSLTDDVNHVVIKPRVKSYFSSGIWSILWLNGNRIPMLGVHLMSRDSYGTSKQRGDMSDVNQHTNTPL